MANYSVGDTIRDYFTVLDASDNPLPGLAVTVVSATQDGTPFFVGTTEVGGGTYYAQFTPGNAGNYYYLLSVNSSPVQYFDNNFDIDGAANAAVVGNLGVGTTTLADLLYGVATECGDIRVLETTAAGASDGTTVIDQIRGSGMPSDSLKGANIWSADPNSGSYWAESRVTGYSGDSQVLVCQPAFPMQIAAGDTMWLTNIYSKGYWRRQYIDSINESRRKFSGSNDVPLNYVLTGTGYTTDNDIIGVTRPAGMTKLYGVSVFNGTDTNEYPVTMSWQNRADKYGWSYDYSAGIINLRGIGFSSLDITSVRLLGFGPEAPLVSPGDTTRMKSSVIVPDAAARLMRGRGDARLLANASQTQNLADNWLPASLVQYPPGTLSVA